VGQLKASEARSLGRQVSNLAAAGKVEEAKAILFPLMVQRIPFRALDRIGEAIGAGDLSPACAFLRSLAHSNALGAWPIVGSALAQQFAREPEETLRICREYILVGGKWFTTDILAERVVGHALASDFETTLAELAPWRQDPSRWIRRAVGVGIHSWGKRSHGVETLAPCAETLLEFLEPLFSERELDSVKGIGWGLKTIGRFYPDRLTRWLHDQCSYQQRPCRRLMLRKAITYLSEEQRAYALEGLPSP
jgi:3-methyladenine DNA glycosylase AlkD